MKYCDPLDGIRIIKVIGIDKKIVPVSEKFYGLRAGLSTTYIVHGRRPYRDRANGGERRLFDISSASTSGV